MTTKSLREASLSPSGEKKSTAWQSDPTTKKREVKEITTDFRKFENVGDEISGVLQARTMQTFSGGNGPNKIVGRYTVMPDGGDRTITFLGTVELDDKLAAVEIGTYIVVRLTGFEKTGKASPMKKYYVGVA